MTNPVSEFNRVPLLSWQLLFIKVLLFALAAVFLSRPAGSISGRIAMEQEGFDLYSYNLKQHKVYATAVGPRDGNEEERGVWVDNDGRFEISQLPVGEYTLKIRVPGFSTTYESGIFVEEAKDTALSSPVMLSISEPSVEVGSNARVFTCKEKPSFWAHAQGATAMSVKLYQRDLLKIISSQDEKKMGVEISADLGLYKPYGAEHKETDIFAGLAPVKSWTRNLAPDIQDWSYENFKCDESLPPGDYFAVVEASNVRHHKDRSLLWFTVTDVGIIVKQDPYRTIVRALDLSSLKPMAGVKVQVLDRGQDLRPVWSQGGVPESKGRLSAGNGSVTTNTDGFAEMPVGKALGDSYNTSLIVYGTVGKQHAYGGMTLSRTTGEQHRTYFYTERPIYRLGQTVYFRGISRDVEGNGFKNPGQLDLSLNLEDPDNASVWSGTVKTNKWGSFHGTLELPADGKTGAYQLHITYPDGTNDYESIEIDEYRKPEYKVDVIPLLTRVDAGEKAKARIKAVYYFGAPVTNAKVKYTIYCQNDWSGRFRLKSRPDYYSYFDDWEGGEGDYSYGGDYICEGTVQTDQAGEAVVEFDTKPVAAGLEGIFESAYEDKKYKVEVEVTDISRLSVLSSGFVSVTPGDFVMFVEPKSYIARVGEKISTDIRAVDYEGNPAAGKKVTVQLLRRLWDRVGHNYRGSQELESVQVDTDKDGNAHLGFSTQAKYVTDTYYIVASAKDEKGHEIRSSNSIWVVSENSPYTLGNDEAQKEPLTVKLDKEVYKPGETVKAMVSAPVTGKEGMQAIVAVEGDRIYNYRAVNLTASATLVEIPLEKSYAPNVFVTVTFVSARRQFFNTSQMIKVAPQCHFLNISVTPDKKKYHPGDMATYTLKAVDADGKPAADVELAMGVVDESIYAIRPEFVQDIRKFFYSQRNNNVTTFCSFPEEYSGGPNKIEPRVRKDFRDTAAWFPSLVTDANGIATAKFKMPDNLTTWRATVRAINLNTEVGWTLQKTVSTQDLIVRLALPRFFCQGDEGEISAVVHNYSDITQNIAVSLSVSPEFQVTKALRQTVKLEPEKVARVSWPAKVLVAGTGKIGVKAIGQTAGDAMETKLPIRALGVPIFIARSGRITEDDRTVDLPLTYPQGVAPGSLDVTLRTTSSSLSSVLGNFNALIDYPYGCTEQTMSKLMPSVVAVKMNKKLGVPLSKADLAKFDKVYKQSMDKLDEYQHADGGWGWWANDTSEPYLTALVLEGYNLLADSGYQVDPERKKRGLAWLSSACERLQHQLADPSLVKYWWQENERMTDLAKATFVESLHKVKPSSKLVAWVGRDDIIKRLNPESLAYYTLAFKSAGLENEARAMYKRLVYLANKQDSAYGMLMNWDRCAEMYKKLADSDKLYYWYYSYRFTGVESTALALRACLVMEPENVDMIESIKTYILTERGKDGWDNTKTTAEVFKAFMEDELSRAQTASVTGGCDFKASVACAGKEIVNLSFDRASISAAEQVTRIDLKPGQNKITLSKLGSGRLYWTCIIKYNRRFKAGETFTVPSTPAALKVQRSFARLTAVYDSNNNVSFKEEPLTGKVKAGETLLMKVKLDSPITVPYTILEVPLPSGAEVVKDNAKEEIAARDVQDAVSWWTHRDIMDDHLAFFVSNYRQGKSEIRTMVRLELPGKFQMNPVTLEGMYTKNVHGYSVPGEIEVVE
jgi:alpha-2-macroglobulin